MAILTLTEAFASYGADIKNTRRWACSAIANDGTLVVSCWKRLFFDGYRRYEDRLSRWRNTQGKNLISNHLKIALKNNLPIRLVLVTPDDPNQPLSENVGFIPKTFSIERKFIGKVVEFDGADLFVIEFRHFGDLGQENSLQEMQYFEGSFTTLDKTTRESVIQSRIGQGLFRTNLVKYWQGCSVTGCKQISLLKASHIKPWRDSSNAERLDVFNGLLLLPNLDACFDLGFITFNDEGEIIISPKLDTATQLQLNINSSLKLLHIDERHKKNLRYHRENIFKSVSGAG